jgi:hypothetical protein
MVTVKCLYCDASNDPVASSGYCDNCGKKLPPAAAYRSRRSGEVGSTDGPPVEPRPGSRTAEALLTVTVVQLVAGGLYLVLAPLILRPVPEDFMVRVLGLMVPPVLALAALSALAGSRPAPAAYAALGLYLSWVVAGCFLAGPLLPTWLPVAVLVLALLIWPAWFGRNGSRRAAAGG